MGEYEALSLTQDDKASHLEVELPMHRPAPPPPQLSSLYSRQPAHGHHLLPSPREISTLQSSCQEVLAIAHAHAGTDTDTDALRTVRIPTG